MVSIPPTAPGVSDWPIVGERVYELWNLASENIEQALTRAAPQLNIFSLGFPTSIILGGIFIWLALAGFLPNFSALQETTFFNMQQLFAS